MRFDGAEGEGGTDSGADAALPRSQGLHPSADHLQEGQRPLLRVQRAAGAQAQVLPLHDRTGKTPSDS